MSTPLDEVVSLAMFARVVECKSFTTAAAKLGLSKSVVSSRISQLEKRIGVLLLHRNTRRVTLTPDGASLYESCLKLVQAAEEATSAVGRVGHNLEGTVRVTFPVGLSLHMPKLIEAFIVKYPAIQVELSCTDRHVNLIEEGFDIGIRVTRVVSDTALSVRRVGSERVVVCAAPKYLQRHGYPERPQDLQAHRCLLSSLHSSVWRLDSERDSFNVAVSGNLVSDNAAILLQAAIDGLGVALLPFSFVAADLEAGRLVRVLEQYATAEFQVFLVHPYQRQVPAKVRALIDYLVQQLQASGQLTLTGSPKRSKRRTGAKLEQ